MTTMTKDDYFQFAEKFFGDCIETSRKKNSDYTGVNADPFANFKVIEVYNIPAEIGFITRMSDKMSRITSFIQKGSLQVEDESVIDTLKDLANYSCLLAALIKSRKNG